MMFKPDSPTVNDPLMTRLEGVNYWNGRIRNLSGMLCWPCVGGNVDGGWLQPWVNQREVTVKGLHHLQEDSPKEIGADIRARQGQLIQVKLPFAGSGIEQRLGLGRRPGERGRRQAKTPT